MRAIFLDCAAPELVLESLRFHGDIVLAMNGDLYNVVQELQAQHPDLSEVILVSENPQEYTDIFYSRNDRLRLNVRWTLYSPQYIHEIPVGLPKALLLDDWRKPSDCRYTDQHLYEVVTCRTVEDALKVAKACPQFDLWLMDYSLDFHGTSWPFMKDILADAPDKWPPEIRVVSEHGDALKFTDEIKAMNPETKVSYPRGNYVAGEQEPAAPIPQPFVWHLECPPNAPYPLTQPAPAPVWANAPKGTNRGVPGKPAVRFPKSKKHR